MDELHGFRDVLKKELKIPALSKEAELLLKEAVKDAAGQILVVELLDGTEIQTNNTMMNKERFGKDVAKWMSAIDELKSNKLLVSVGSKNEIYQLTKYGYDVSENL